MYKKFLDFTKKNWILFALILIMLLSFGLRISVIDISKPFSFDPIYQYRYTKYVVEDGVLPSWDEYSYYPPGRTIANVTAPFLYYLTGYLYIIFNPLLGMSLMVFCSYITALYAAMAVIPAYLLGKELSDKRAGMLAAFFVGINSFILSRTVSYDTDALVVFFSLLSIYLLIRLFKKKSYLNYFLAIFCLTLFGLTWIAAWYIPIIVILSTIVYLFILMLSYKKDKISERLKKSLLDFKNIFIPLVIVFITANVIAILSGYDIISNTLTILAFSQDPAKVLIVNISVAELQILDVFGGAWDELFLRIGIPFIFTIPGALLLLKKDKMKGSLLLTWALVSFYALTKGVRFLLVFSSVACIASAVAFSEFYQHIKRTGSYAPLISFGFLGLILLSLTKPIISFVLSIFLTLILLLIKKEENVHDVHKPIFIAAILIALIITFSQSSQSILYAGSGERANENWVNAYSWLKENSAEDSVVGSWWDPGHEIAGLAERRNIADGAHCTDQYCSPGLNTRITHLGKIFTTSNETEAKELLLKYKGNASEMYWIVSDDLIGKFRWLQYFGTGCDGTGIYTPNGQTICPLYSQIPAQSYSYDQNYTIKAYQYGAGLSAFEQDGQWIVIMENNGKNYIFQKEVIYLNGTPQLLDFSWSNDTAPGTVWLQPDNSYVVFIPPPLENSMFTRMFFYEDPTLKNFEMVYKNEQVKIYKLII